MTSISKKAIVAAMTAVIGLGAIAPAMAQNAPDAPPPPAAGAPLPPDANGPMGPGHRPHDGGPGRPGGEGLFDFGRGGEEMEIALVRLSHRIDLTAEQKTLFDTFKTDALAAAEKFTTATEGLRPTPPAEGETPVRPTFTERLDKRIEMQKAELAALEAVQPSAKAFFDSLTEEQLAQLAPPRGGPGFGRHGGPGAKWNQGAKGPQGEPGAPEAPVAPDAPAAPDQALPTT